jgi:hypothetical protein
MMGRNYLDVFTGHACEACRPAVAQSRLCSSDGLLVHSQPGWDPELSECSDDAARCAQVTPGHRGQAHGGERRRVTLQHVPGEARCRRKFVSLCNGPSFVFCAAETVEP